ncbi:glycosyltransferase [Candidatus Sumerlaeota bacterium]|nr:glycosyltransferase [Candidatus Sumerlaeota bacterium]
MKVLFVCTRSPWPPNAGAPLRTAGWIRAIASEVDVGVLALTRNAEEEAGLESAKESCSFVQGVRAPRTLWRRGRDAILSAAMGAPYVVQASAESRMREALRAALRSWRPDIVQAEPIGAAPYLSIAKAAGIATVYSAHNVESRILSGLGGRPAAIGSRSSERMARLERKIAREADCVVAVGEQEAAWFREVAGNATVVPNAIASESYAYIEPSRRPRDTIVFVGHLGYGPNRDAVRTLVLTILPLICQHRRDAKVLIAGNSPSRDVRDLAGPRVEILGSVPDAASVWARASALVCPLRWGAGSRLKLLESAACGVPIVATRFSAEGLAFREGEHFVAADDPHDVAAAAVRVLSDPPAWDAMARKARDAVRLRHDWNVLLPDLVRLYEDTLARHHRS